jgi:hypothetical protein
VPPGIGTVYPVSCSARPGEEISRIRVTEGVFETLPLARTVSIARHHEVMYAGKLSHRNPFLLRESNHSSCRASKSIAAAHLRAARGFRFLGDCIPGCRFIDWFIDVSNEKGATHETDAASTSGDDGISTSTQRSHPFNTFLRCRFRVTPKYYAYLLRATLG